MANTRNTNTKEEIILLDQESARFMKARTEAQRVQFMPTLIALLLAFLLLGMSVLEYLSPNFILFAEPASWQVLALKQIIHFGLIPLLVITLVLLIYKPSIDLLARHKDKPLSIFSALWLGIAAAFAYYLVVVLLSRINVLDLAKSYLPASLNTFEPFLHQSTGRAVAALSFSVLLPTVTLVPLLLGLFLTPLLSSEKRMLSLLFTCLLGALLPLETQAFFAYLLLWILLTRIYVTGSGLITAAIAGAVFMTTLMLAPGLFSLLSSHFIAWQSTSDLQGTLLIFALILIILVLGLPGIFHFNLLDRAERRNQLALSVQPHISKHIEKTKDRLTLSWILIAISLVLFALSLIADYFL